MPKTKHITVSVDPRLYHETRKLAAEYDTTVTALVTFLLERLPRLLIQNGFRPASSFSPAPSRQSFRPGQFNQRVLPPPPNRGKLAGDDIASRLNSFMLNELLGVEEPAYSRSIPVRVPQTEQSK